MTAAVVLGALAGLGCLGLLRGLRSPAPSLETLARTMARPMQPAVAGPDTGGWPSEIGPRWWPWSAEMSSTRTLAGRPCGPTWPSPEAHWTNWRPRWSSPEVADWCCPLSCGYSPSGLV